MPSLLVRLWWISRKSGEEQKHMLRDEQALSGLPEQVKVLSFVLLLDQKNQKSRANEF